MYWGLRHQPQNLNTTGKKETSRNYKHLIMDQFEKHIRDNKQVFNDRKADRSKMWANIESQLNTDKPKVIPLWKSPMIRIAASILILLGISNKLLDFTIHEMTFPAPVQ